MSAHQDLGSRIRIWLHGRLSERPDPYPILEEVLSQLPATPQRRSRRWWPRRDVGSTSAATSTERFPMLSAVSLTIAAGIVVLVGGLLLSGVLDTQQDDTVPLAAATEPPSPTTTGELLTGMVTEEVEPGVFRVVNDGYRKPSAGGFGSSVEITPDGSVWLHGGGPVLHRLGDEATFDDPAELHGSVQVAPDNSLWAIGQYLDDYTSVFSFDGQGWTERATKTDYTFGFADLAIAPDGTVWVTTTDERKYCPDIEGRECPGTFLLRLEDDGSLTTIDDWADVYDGDAHPYSLVVSPDGDVWLRGERRSGGPEAEVLLRFDGSGWESLPLPEGVDPSTFLPFGVAPDGTPWVQVRGRAAGHSGARGVARFDDSGWTVFIEPDDGSGWQGWGSGGEPVWFGEDLFTVAADGSLWHPGRPTEENPCGGVAHFDGATWTTHLVESCVSDLAIAPDGSVWLLAVDLYVITREAMADGR